MIVFGGSSVLTLASVLFDMLNSRIRMNHTFAAFAEFWGTDGEGLHVSLRGNDFLDRCLVLFFVIYVFLCYDRLVEY